jgi:hypothetical protein
MAAPAPLAPIAPIAPLAPLTPAAMAIAPVAPIPPVPPVPPVPPTRRGKVMIDGHEKDWSELTPQEKARIRAAMDQARHALRNTHFDRTRVNAELAEARAELAANRIDMQRELAGARREVAQAMREIDRNAAELRRHGQDPEALKAQVRASLKAVEGIDVDAITRQALASIDEAAIERSLAAAEDGVRRAEEAIDAADKDD